jgi:hypothetical protein
MGAPSRNLDQELSVTSCCLGEAPATQSGCDLSRSPKLDRPLGAVQAGTGDTNNRPCLFLQYDANHRGGIIGS